MRCGYKQRETKTCGQLFGMTGIQSTHTHNVS
jgi:hypothetical protein